MGKVCPNCGTPGMVHETRVDVVEYVHDGETYRRSINQPAWWCDACGEGVMQGDELLIGEQALFELRAQAHGVLTPGEVKRIRKKLDLTQTEAGAILGGGVKAFYKYESGRILPSVAISNLLRLLDHQPSLLDHLKSDEAA
ncbi:MAG: type II toxin-antitoxin system MqsA family antitoxin [Bradymonadia bacterium]